ncbi:MAG: SDR family NAD(P)-dependent oxidoreductase [Clostridia bacterium]|nr:SDR family NAD(P)-dependent oxidoreductase [Clostridia bacterium]MDY2901695.1 SDR family NAD(P)-dependent oxidoreductase [Christensenellaceae bacterium]
MGYTLITGACGGLGKEFCRQLLKSDDLFLTGRSEQKLLLLKEELLKSEPDRKIETFAADLTSAEDRKKLFDYADENGIKFSGYIGVAGADIQKEFLKYTPEKVVFQVRLNFEASVAVCHAVLKRRAENLKILSVSSMSGSTPMPFFAIYSATKSALINFYTALRYEVNDAKITVLAPGGIPTRDDVKRDIEIQGWTGKLSAKPAEFVVKKALKGLEKNKRLVIPGFFNKFVYGLEKIVPMSVKCRFVAKKWKNKEKDAF